MLDRGLVAACMSALRWPVAEVQDWLVGPEGTSDHECHDSRPTTGAVVVASVWVEQAVTDSPYTRGASEKRLGVRPSRPARRESR